jgi:hypothetical protein
MQYSPFAAFYARLIRKLCDLRLPLLSESIFGRDFVGISSPLHIDFVVPESLLPFEPLIIGTVRDLYDMVCAFYRFDSKYLLRLQGQGFVTVELALPRHATHSVDALFWNQVACLVRTVRRCPDAPAVSVPFFSLRINSYTLQGAALEDVLEWSTNICYSSFEADDMRIFVEVDQSVTVFIALMSVHSGVI